MLALSITQLAVDATGSDINNPFTYLTGLGFPGIIIGLLVTGQLRTKSEVDRIVTESEAKDEIIKLKDKQIEALQTGIIDKAIPALTRSTQVLEQIPREVLSDQANDTKRAIELLRRRIEDLAGGGSES